MTALEIPQLALVVVCGPPDDPELEAFVAREFSPAERQQPFSLQAALARLDRGELALLRLAERLGNDVSNDLRRLCRQLLVPLVLLVRPPEHPEQQRQLLRAADAVARQKKVPATVHRFLAPGEAERARLVRRPLPCDRRQLRGPFDVNGDVHGCMDELELLLPKLGYTPDPQDGLPRHPAGRQLVFVGDLVDRGPRVLDVLRLVMGLVAAGRAHCVLGNHDDKFLRWLRGGKVKIAGGLGKTVAEVEALPPAEWEALRPQLITFLSGLPIHIVLDQGRLVVVHAAMKEQWIGRTGERLRAYALYGDTTGKVDADGFPQRRDWAQSYTGAARIVYGHQPVETPRWVNKTADVDTGCCFGGTLTAVRYPEGEFVQVPAAGSYHPRRDPKA